MPVQDKEELVALLKQELTTLIVFCQEHGFDPLAIVPTQGFGRVPWLDEAENKLLVSDDVKLGFMKQARLFAQLYKAILPHPKANDYKPLYDIFVALVVAIRRDTEKPEDIGSVMAEVERLVDMSIVARRYVIRETKAEYGEGRYLDLSKIDFDALREKFATSYKHTEAEKLRSAIASKINTMLKLNKGRINYQEKFEQIIADYNAGSSNVDIFYTQLLDFVHDDLQAEEKRHLAEQLSEEELTVFDMLMKSEENGVALTESEQEQVKKVVRTLLETLKHGKLILDWRKKQQAQAAVKKTVRDTLRQELPPAYSQQLRELKWQEIFQHIYESYDGDGKSIYVA